MKTQKMGFMNIKDMLIGIGLITRGVAVFMERYLYAKHMAAKWHPFKYNKESIFHIGTIKGLTLIIICSLSSNLLNAQTPQANLRLDSLSIDEILKIESDSFKPKIKYDSIHVELFIFNERLAIIPISHRSQINGKMIKSTKYEMERLPDNKLLLKIIQYISIKK